MTIRDGQVISQLRSSAVRSYRVGRAAAELAVTAGNTSRQGGVGVVKGSADVALKYRTLKAEAGLSTHPIEDKFFRLAGDTATVSGMVLSAIALPAMARKAATSFQELKTLLSDPTATASARLDKLEEMTRAGAGTVFSAQGVVVGARGTMGILSRSEGIARVASRVGESPLVSALGKPFGMLFRVLLPVADVAVLVGESIATRRTFLDPQATGWQKGRKVLDLGLATLKAAFWLLPAARPLKAAYAAASFAQLVLTLKDFWPTVKPALVDAARGTAWVVTHPAEAVRAAGDGLVNGARAAAGGIKTAARGLWGIVSQPRRAWDSTAGFVGSVRGLLLRPFAPATGRTPSRSPGGLAAPLPGFLAGPDGGPTAAPVPQAPAPSAILQVPSPALPGPVTTAPPPPALPFAPAPADLGIGPGLPVPPLPDVAAPAPLPPVPGPTGPEGWLSGPG